jgi:hypothetical protein
LTDGDGILKGIISHYVDGDTQLKLNVYRKDDFSSNYELLSLPVNKVIDFTLDNVLFFAKYFFPECDIQTLGVADFSQRLDESKYDDVKLLEFTFENGLRLADPVVIIGDGGDGDGGGYCL